MPIIVPPAHFNQTFVDVYPNPATNQLTLVLVTLDNVTVKIEDVTGRILRTIEFDDEAVVQTLDISDLASDVYLVVATDKNNNYIQRTKFVKMKEK